MKRGNRIRKVKCDEARPSCERCTSTGRACDGYELPSSDVRREALERRGKRRLYPQGRQSYITGVQLCGSVQSFPNLSRIEHQSFTFFQHHTANEIPGYFGSQLWSQTILQLCQSEPCILHAAVAVSALHRFMRGRCPSLQVSILLEPGMPFAIREYIKSVDLLRRRLDQAGDSCGQIALIACLLFICLEMLQGNRVGAIAHLRTGLRILSMQKMGRQTDMLCFESTSPVDQVESIFNRLDYESAMFGEPSPVLGLASFNSPLPNLIAPTGFSCVTEARNSLGCLYNAALRFRGELIHLAAVGMEDHKLDLAARHCIHHARTKTVDLTFRPDLIGRQAGLRFELERWISLFKEFSQNSSSAYAQSVILLEIQHFYIYFIICTCRNTHEVACDEFNDLFRRIVYLSKLFIHGASTALLSQPPVTFTLESGAVPSLYLIAMKFRNPATRHDAISLLEQTNCQEGMWEGQLIARFVTEIADLEEETTGITPLRSTEIPESSRFDSIVMATDIPGHGRLVCTRYQHELTGSLEIQMTERRFRL